MARTLFLLDLYSFIHAGAVNKRAKLERTVFDSPTWKTLVTPLGGTSLVFNTLYETVGRGDIVVCSDRNPTIKKDMLPTYKSNRSNKPAISVDAAAAESILQECGVTVLARAGYEADDIIYTLTKKLKDQYDEVVIYTADSDLFFLVDDKVSIHPSNSNGKYVTRSNYEEVLKKKGAIYNTLTVQKIIKGDVSDSIPALPKDLQNKVASTLYRDLFYEKLGDKETVQFWVQNVVPEALHQVNLVFPLDVDDLPMEFSIPDKNLIRNFGSAMNNRMYRGLGDPTFDVHPFVESLQEKGYYIEKEV